MSEEKSSYRQIMKATSIFGGVQVITILISIIRSKIIAIYLGPMGIGIAGLLTTSLSLLGGFTNFGLGSSAVRDVSKAYAEGDKTRVAKVTIVVRRLVWITGSLGVVLAFFAAPWLSMYTFGNHDYVTAFRWLSVTLLLNQLASGQNILLQGTRQLKDLAKATVWGSLLGLTLSGPLYYFYGIDGIVPALIGSSIIMLIISKWFARKILLELVPVSKRNTFIEGKSMLKMGFMLSLSGLITAAVGYIVRAFISKTGSVEDVGLFTAGFTIIGSYVGLLFSAMSTDYYPRLSAVVADTKKTNDLINQQAEIGILIIGPILCLFIIFASLIVKILYSSEFEPITEMIQWAAMGMFFKAASFPIGYLFLAKGASKVFFWSELVANVYMLSFNILGYMFFGLNGLGISFLLGFTSYYLQVFIISKKLYQFNSYKTFSKILLIHLLLGTLCFFLTLWFSSVWSYVFGSALILISCFYSFSEMDKKILIKQFIKEKVSKR